MSVWKKVSAKVLESGVNKELFEKALVEELGIKLDYSVNSIRNGYGADRVDCAIINNNKVTALGINFKDNGGVELSGDIWGSGLGGDGKQEGLMDRMAQAYQKHNMISKLEAHGYQLDDVTVNEKQQIVINAFQW